MTRPGSVAEAEISEESQFALGETPALLDQVGAGIECAPQSTCPAPSVDPAVISRAEHLGHLHAPEHRRLGQLGVHEEPHV